MSKVLPETVIWGHFPKPWLNTAETFAPFQRGFSRLLRPPGLHDKGTGFPNSLTVSLNGRGVFCVFSHAFRGVKVTSHHVVFGYLD